jgi:pre-rRNA-processing protein IPI1
LSYLTTSISSRAVDAPLPVSSFTLLSKLFPLVLDGSSNVRSQLLKLLRALPVADVQDHVSEFLPYTRAAMTHLAADIRLFAIDLLGWLLEKAGNEVVSCPGGWTKTMNCFLTVLGWHTQDSGKWSGNGINFGKPGSEGRPMARALQVMATFLEAGLATEATETGDNSSAATFPIWYVEQHLLPQKSNAFGYLDLFAMSKDGENESMEDRDARLWLFDSMFRSNVERGIESARTEGGEVGRTAAALAKVVRENVKGDG